MKIMFCHLWVERMMIITMTTTTMTLLTSTIFVWFRVALAAFAIPYTHHGHQHHQCRCFQHQSFQNQCRCCQNWRNWHEANTQEANTQGASFTNATIILMNNKTATEIASNLSVTPVSNQPHLLNKSTKKQKYLNENQEFNKPREVFGYQKNDRIAASFKNGGFADGG